MERFSFNCCLSLPFPLLPQTIWQTLSSALHQVRRFCGWKALMDLNCYVVASPPSPEQKHERMIIFNFVSYKSHFVHVFALPDFVRIAYAASYGELVTYWRAHYCLECMWRLSNFYLIHQEWDDESGKSWETSVSLPPHSSAFFSFHHEDLSDLYLLPAFCASSPIECGLLLPQQEDPELVCVWGMNMKFHVR